MEKILEQLWLDIYREVSNMSIMWKIFFVAIVIPIIRLAKDPKFISVFLESISKLWKTLRRQDLETHYLFYSEHQYLAQIHNISFSCTEKTKAFRIILEEKAKVIVEETLAWVRTEKDKLAQANGRELAAMLYNHTKYLIEEYEDRALERYKEEFGAETGERLWKYVYPAFQTFHADKISFIELNIGRLAAAHKINFEYALGTYFSLLDTAMVLAISDLYITFEKFNGNIRRIIHGEDVEDV